MISSIDITATPGSQVQPPPEGDRYLGFVFAKGPDRETVEASLRQARDLVDVTRRMTGPMSLTVEEPICPIPASPRHLNLYLTVSAYPRKRA